MLCIYVVNLVGSFSTVPTEYTATTPEDDLRNIKSLSCDYGIKKSRYIEHFENLPLFNCLIKKLRICLCARDIERRQYFVNCWSKHKTTIPTTLPINTTHLDFSFNTFRRLKSGSFKNAAQLMFLDFAHNFIDYIERGAFINLPNLQFLDISMNQLSGFHSNRLFSPLISLRVLDVSYFPIESTESLISALSDLPHINKLAVATATTRNLKFPLFKNLTDFILTPPINRNELPRKNDQKTIVSFYFGSSSEKIDLPKNFFRFAENNLRYISLPGNHVGSIENGTFSSLKQLKVLDFSQRGILIPGTRAGKFNANLFSNLSGIQAESIILGNIQIPVDLSQKTFQAPNLRNLNLNDNNIIKFWKRKFSEVLQ